MAMEINAFLNTPRVTPSRFAPRAPPPRSHLSAETFTTFYIVTSKTPVLQRNLK
jgi:hypothetical protein